MITVDSTSRWYVVHTHPRAEARAALNLDRQGFTCYLPRYLKRRRHARRIETVAAPLFPRYLFVALDLATQRWWPIRSTFGVTNLVYNGEQPATVSSGIIQAIKAREDALGLVSLPRKPRFAPGDTVRIIDGVFASCLGLFDGMADRERVAVLLELLGRKVRVFMDEEALAAV
jgi:transcriptional antiterminator RfaH